MFYFCVSVVVFCFCFCFYCALNLFHTPSHSFTYAHIYFYCAGNAVVKPPNRKIICYCEFASHRINYFILYFYLTQLFHQNIQMTARNALACSSDFCIPLCCRIFSTHCLLWFFFLFHQNCNLAMRCAWHYVLTKLYSAFNYINRSLDLASAACLWHARCCRSHASRVHSKNVEALTVCMCVVPARCLPQCSSVALPSAPPLLHAKC